MAVLETKGLTKSFGDEEVLRGLDFEVGEGEIFGLVGPSGAGKSTLIRLLTGYLRPTKGEVRVFGRDPTSFGGFDRRSIGFMPQSFVLYDGLSVRQNLNFVAGLYGLKFLERRRLVREALEFVELWDDRGKAATNISGGMQRRLQLAAALVHDPPLLFVDEPTANLDPILRRKFWEEFATLRDDGRTIFVTTQYVGEAEQCDRVALLSGGRIVALGTPEELRRRAFDGEVVELVLGGDPGHVGEQLSALENVGHVVEVREAREPGEAGENGNGPEETVSRARLVVEDADRALPRVFDALNGADVRSADVLYPSFDEVFFRLVRGW